LFLTEGELRFSGCRFL